MGQLGCASCLSSLVQAKQLLTVYTHRRSYANDTNNDSLSLQEQQARHLASMSAPEVLQVRSGFCQQAVWSTNPARRHQMPINACLHLVVVVWARHVQVANAMPFKLSRGQCYFFPGSSNLPGCIFV